MNVRYINNVKNVIMFFLNINQENISISFIYLYEDG